MAVNAAERKVKNEEGNMLQKNCIKPFTFEFNISDHESSRPTASASALAGKSRESDDGLESEGENIDDEFESESESKSENIIRWLTAWM